MIRCTIELLPKGDENRRRTIGLVEIANDGTGSVAIGNYTVALKKTPPFRGALRAIWRDGQFAPDVDDEDVMSGRVEGQPRQSRGVYDLLYRALKACRLEQRVPE